MKENDTSSRYNDTKKLQNGIGKFVKDSAKKKIPGFLEDDEVPDLKNARGYNNITCGRLLTPWKLCEWLAANPTECALRFLSAPADDAQIL